jgi:hypothetical protein
VLRELGCPAQPELLGHQPSNWRVDQQGVAHALLCFGAFFTGKSAQVSNDGFA